MKKVPLADVLWNAANKYLAKNETRFERDKWPPSCCAVAEAIGLRWPNGLHKDSEGVPTFEFLASLGCTTRSHSEICGLADVQGVRYMWLLLAMHVAADEKIMVEVA